MNHLTKAMLNALACTHLQKQIRSKADLFSTNDKLLKNTDQSILSHAGLILGDIALLQEIAKGMVELTAAPPIVTSTFIRFYFLDEPDAEIVRARVLEISREQESRTSLLKRHRET